MFRRPTDALRYISARRSSGRRRQSRRPISLRIASLGGKSVLIRPHTSDVVALADTFVGRYHSAPAGRRAPTTILDLGANIGLTAADFASEFPDARIIAVEMDEENARLCEQNIAPWKSRVKVINRAVWVDAEPVAYLGSPGDEYGFHVLGGTDSREGEVQRVAETVTLDQLVEQFGPVDYLKMDIEGAEQAVLQSPDRAWAEHVDAIQVECHGEYSVEQCIEDLTVLGFAAQRDQRHWAAVRGHRPR